jgi:hypothetical protein
MSPSRAAPGLCCDAPGYGHPIRSMRKTASNVDLRRCAAIDENAGNCGLQCGGRYRTDNPNSREARGGAAPRRTLRVELPGCDKRWTNLRGLLVSLHWRCYRGGPRRATRPRSGNPGRGEEEIDEEENVLVCEAPDEQTDKSRVERPKGLIMRVWSRSAAKADMERGFALVPASSTIVPEVLVRDLRRSTSRRRTAHFSPTPS